jgi:hypothetical protein
VQENGGVKEPGDGTVRTGPDGESPEKKEDGTTEVPPEKKEGDPESAEKKEGEEGIEGNKIDPKSGEEAA